ncbi:hypothetical protein FRX31_013291 [Thalictrum thalictroides]|uniref:UDP-glucose/GDP-mannose dehydrogenase N-terminal domain-containing protein n=1 Tax=Thalictrum thalictroides TaxID=46969 RepID=A0A7J6WLX7_THATH|nr:hypothetical protein FRX31_013291 [Thalictrum thalictroides]
MTVLAAMCPNIRIIICDVNQKNFDDWESGIVPFYETDMHHVLHSPGVLGQCLCFSEDIEETLEQAKVIIVVIDISVDKVNEGYRHNLAKWRDSWQWVVQPDNDNKLVIDKSNMPPDALSMVEEYCENGGVNLAVVFNPE